MAEAICHRLRMSNDDTAQILALVDNHMRFGDAPRMKESTLKRFMRLPQFDEHLALHRIDCLCSHGKLEIHDFLRDKLENTPPEEIRPAPLINGHDLIRLGLHPGPAFADMLSTVEDAQLEDKLLRLFQLATPQQAEAQQEAPVGNLTRIARSLDGLARAGSAGCVPDDLRRPDRLPSAARPAVRAARGPDVGATGRGGHRLRNQLAELRGDRLPAGDRGTG